MLKTVFKISKMDCPSEENLIRMKLSDIASVKQLNFDLEDRFLTIFHTSDLVFIKKAIKELNLNEQKISTEKTDSIINESQTNQSKLLWTVLIINFVFFMNDTTINVLRVV